MRRLRGWALLLLAMLVPAATAWAADPGAPGPYATQHLSYRLAPLRVPTYRTPLEVRGDVMLPIGAPGARPLVFVLHGQHRTCMRRRGAFSPVEIGWPCPKGWQMVPNYLGYRWLTRMLASQGDIAVSISANSVNAQNDRGPSIGADERAQLVRHHIALWARWGAEGGDPWGGAIRGTVDAMRVALVGHSRGGEGVAQAAAAARTGDPFRVRGLALIAPTAFARQVTPGVDTMVLLPYCDGDVSDLQGQSFVDGRRDLTPDGSLRSAVLLLGANHNYFNTVWARDGELPDDWMSGSPADRACAAEGRGRLTGGAQRAAARAYVGALVRASLDQDPDAVAVLQGTVPTPASAGRVTALVSQWGGGDRLLYAPRLARPVRATRMGAAVCRGYVRGAATACVGFSGSRVPHWTEMSGGGPFPAPTALALRWVRAGGSVALPLTEGTVDATGVPTIALRVAFDPDIAGQRLALRLTDASGGTTDITAMGPAPRRLPGPRGSGQMGEGSALPKLWAQTLRFPLDPAAVDVARLIGVAVVARSPRGRAWLLDAALEAPAVRPAADVVLPSLRVGRMRLNEWGDRGRRVVRLPIEVSGAVTRPVRLAVQITDDRFTTTWRPITIPAGGTGATVPITVRADNRHTGTRRIVVQVVALRDAVVARADGWLDVRDDDPR